MAASRPYIGGQAVLEGVMMRSPTSFAVVVSSARRLAHRARARDARRADGRRARGRSCAASRRSSSRCKLGSEALRFQREISSRRIWAPRTERPTRRRGGARRPVGARASSLLRDARPAATARPVQRAASASAKGGSMAHARRSPSSFFVALPQGAAAGVNRLFHLGLEVQSPGVPGDHRRLQAHDRRRLPARSSAAMPEIRRVFQYHGAEHKTISTYEASEALTVDERAREDDAAPALRDDVPRDGRARLDPRLHRASARLLPRIHTGQRARSTTSSSSSRSSRSCPLIAAVTFEIQRVFARYCTTGPLRALLWPGFLVQKITTIEPDDAQLEVALASLRATLLREEAAQARRGARRPSPFAELRRAPGAERLRLAPSAAPEAAAASHRARHAPPREARAARAPLSGARRPALLARRPRRSQQAPEAQQGADATSSRSSQAFARYRDAREEDRARTRRRSPIPSSASSREVELPELDERARRSSRSDSSSSSCRRIRTTRRTPSSRSAAARAAKRRRSSRPTSSACIAATPRRKRLEDRGPQRRARAAAGGIKEVHRARHRQGRLLAAPLRGRRAPRAARAGDRDAGAHPHVDRDRRRAARGRRRRRPHRRQGSRDLASRRAAGPAGRASTRPTAPCRSATSRRASSSSARTSARSSRTRRRR